MLDLGLNDGGLLSFGDIAHNFDLDGYAINYFGWSIKKRGIMKIDLDSVYFSYLVEANAGEIKVIVFFELIKQSLFHFSGLV